MITKIQQAMLVLTPNGTPSATPRVQLDCGNDDDDSHSLPQKYVESGNPQADRRNRSISSFQRWKEKKKSSFQSLTFAHNITTEWHTKLDKASMECTRAGSQQPSCGDPFPTSG